MGKHTGNDRGRVSADGSGDEPRSEIDLGSQDVIRQILEQRSQHVKARSEKPLEIRIGKARLVETHRVDQISIWGSFVMWVKTLIRNIRHRFSRKTRAASLAEG